MQHGEDPRFENRCSAWVRRPDGRDDAPGDAAACGHASRTDGKACPACPVSFAATQGCSGLSEGRQVDEGSVLCSLRALRTSCSTSA